MTPAAARAIPAKEPTEVRPARDLLPAVADAPAAEPDELPEPLPPLPPSEKPVAVALAEVPEPEAVPMKEEVRVQSHDELKYAEE